MARDWEIDLPGGRSKGDEEIVVDTTSTEPLRIAAADEPEEVEALQEKLAKARGASSSSSRPGSETETGPDGHPEELTG